MSQHLHEIPKTLTAIQMGNELRSSVAMLLQERLHNKGCFEKKNSCSQCPEKVQLILNEHCSDAKCTMVKKFSGF